MRTRYFEVTSSWGTIVAVQDGPAIGFRAEELARDYFCDTFDMKEFFRGAEAREIAGGPGDDVDVTTLDSYGVPIDDD